MPTLGHEPLAVHAPWAVAQLQKAGHVHTFRRVRSSRWSTVSSVSEDCPRPSSLPPSSSMQGQPGSKLGPAPRCSHLCPQGGAHRSLWQPWAGGGLCDRGGAAAAAGLPGKRGRRWGGAGALGGGAWGGKRRTEEGRGCALLHPPIFTAACFLVKITRAAMFVARRSCIARKLCRGLYFAGEHSHYGACSLQGRCHTDRCNLYSAC